jgi:hypothetical protein
VAYQSIGRFPVVTRSFTLMGDIHPHRLGRTPWDTCGVTHGGPSGRLQDTTGITGGSPSVIPVSHKSSTQGITYRYPLRGVPLRPLTAVLSGC